MKQLSEVVMTWNPVSQQANYDFADVVGYTQEQVRDEIFHRFHLQIREVTNQKLKWRENAKKKSMQNKNKTTPIVIVRKKRVFTPPDK